MYLDTTQIEIITHILCFVLVVKKYRLIWFLTVLGRSSSIQPTERYIELLTQALVNLRLTSLLLGGQILVPVPVVLDVFGLIPPVFLLVPEVVALSCIFP